MNTINRKFLVVLSLHLSLLAAAANAMGFEDKDLSSEESLWDLYERWRSHHTTTRDLGEKKKRFNVFKDNVNFIHSFNKMDATCKLKLNKFGDMTHREFKSIYAGSRVDHHRALRGNPNWKGRFMYENVSDVPVSIDWREKGAVTAVKNQGHCGSCWAFSTICAVEGINAIKGNQLVSLSEQELVDCDRTEFNKGCNGGLMEDAFDFIKQNGGVTMETNYPYTAQDGTCNSQKEDSDVVVIDGHENVPANDEEALLKAAANQPIAVAIDASSRAFQFYSEGVFSGECEKYLDHGVNIVGYGTTADGTKYWTVRNSWGPEWGEKGYMRMARSVAAKEGLCGIAMEASYPIKNSQNPGVGLAKDEL